MDICFCPTIQFCFWLCLTVLFLPTSSEANSYLYTNSYGIWGFITNIPYNSYTVTITSHTGTNTEVIIPDTIDALPVTGIGPAVFFTTSGAAMTKVIIPNSVTEIREYAFHDCASLTDVTMPYGLVDIRWFAFAGCSSLTNVTIPESVVTIDNQAFYACGSLTNVAIPNRVRTIGSGAFEACTSLTSAIIPNSVTNIGVKAFANCTSLTAISVETNNSVYSSVNGVLFNQNQTTLIEYPGGKVGSYSIPNSVTCIGDGAFSGCGLTSITIPYRVTDIPMQAFIYCASLTNVTIPNGVTSIGPGAFSGCGLTSVKIPNSVTYIGDYAFSGTSLTSVTIPENVTYIGQIAFQSCSNLTSVFFLGNAPSAGIFYAGQHSFLVFDGDNATAHYLPGTTGWGSTYGGIPTALWSLPYPVILQDSLRVQTNGFAFTASWATNLSVVVEATPDLKNPNWSPFQTNLLNNGVANFTDPEWTNYPSRFYRVRSQ